MNLLENIVTDMSPQEFEVYCLELLEGMKEQLHEFRLEHNKIYSTNDGRYQLDGYIQFELFGVKYKTIVECKKYKDKIKRSQIQVLHDTIRSTGAHKGIFISTSSFQKGAMDYAKEHGIALMQIVDGVILTIQNSSSPRKYINTQVPKYFFAWYDLDCYCPIDAIYGKKNNSIVQYLLDVKV
jgi:restriction endonuclease Mrr